MASQYGGSLPHIPLLDRLEDQTKEKYQVNPSKQRRGSFKHRYYVAGLALGQLTILAFGWGFLGAKIYWKEIPMTDGLARLAFSQPEGTTFVAGIVASCIAKLSVWLYSRAVRRAITSTLVKGPMSLQFFGFSVKVLGGALFLNKKHPAWTWASIPVWAVICTLTASPTTVSQSGSVRGTELDLGSSALAHLVEKTSKPFMTNASNIVTALNPQSYDLMDIAGFLAGQSSGGARVGLPSTFNFNGASYNISTAFSGGYVKPDTVIDTHLSGLSQNYSVFQQGLTAEVSCTQQNLTFPAPNSLTYKHSTTSAAQSSAIYTLWTGVSGPSNNSFTIAIDGSSHNGAPSSRYDFIKPTICEVTPWITDVAVGYNNFIISPGSPQKTQLLGERSPSSMAFITSLVQWIGGRAQADIGNTMADSVSVIMASQNQTSTLVNTILEDYWRGVVEYAGTYLRLGYSAGDPNEMESQTPSNMSRAFNGTVYTTTMGWSYQSATALFTLIPQTVISLLTIAILMLPCRKTLPLGVEEDFDVAEVSDVVLAMTSDGTEIHGSPPKDGTVSRKDKENIRLEVLQDNRKRMIVETICWAVVHLLLSTMVFKRELGTVPPLSTLADAYIVCSSVALSIFAPVRRLAIKRTVVATPGWLLFQ
ncbi:hypothetical protein CONPUDRAFT_78045 [Coniophora puteana RWD-64-598 SS2]|uniref:Uncharacterized protein n=1 Tax=Coniophora puteana (strain RWD-64-598) TaxID=741705 RepID=R7SDY5_CONPW|nr:uncharacterized protein CONPUDRAFT_78045 [Coniophora puteana RWD-64-598 SS2]EIW74378.1 hypothetical protein CONPUDRAFT_78045 [Coniophora puteana RWD-64-598 SS2]